MYVRCQRRVVCGRKLYVCLCVCMSVCVYLCLCVYVCGQRQDSSMAESCMYVCVCMSVSVSVCTCVVRDKSRLWQKADRLSFERRVRKSNWWVSSDDILRCTSCHAEFTVTVRKVQQTNDYDTIRCEMLLHSKASISQLYLMHGSNN